MSRLRPIRPGPLLARARAAVARPSPRDIVLTAAVLVVSTTMGVVTGSVGSAALTVADLAVLVLLGLGGRPIWAVPSLVVSIYTTAIGIGGALVGNTLGAAGTGAVTETLDPGQITSTYVLFILASLLISLPTLLVSPMLRPSSSDTAIPKKLDRPLVIVAVVVALVAVLALGPAWLIARADRFGETSAITNAISTAALGMCLLLGAPLLRARGATRWAAAAAVAVFVVIFFSSASRYLCLVPLAVLGGMVVLGGLRRRIWAWVAGAAAASVLLLPIPLFLRGSTIGHGVVPYIAWLGRFRPDPAFLLGNLNSVLVSFRITGVTAFAEPRIPAEALWISLAPQSGTSIGWYAIAPSLRLNVYSPYSGLGELGNHGPVALLLVLIAIGLVMAALALLGSYLSTRLIGRFIAAGVLAVQLLFAVQFTQYNLRGDIRLLYYSLTAEVVCCAVLLLLRLRARGRGRHLET